VSKLWIGITGLLVWAGTVVAATNLAAPVASMASTSARTNDPVEAEFQKLMETDDNAHAEVDGWIRENEAFAAKGGGTSRDEMRQRIRQRLSPIGKAYLDFLERHPRHVKARVAYASFLSDFEGEEAAEAQLEKALEVETNDPAIYNNLANIYGHIGSVKKAFEYYARAIQLNPLEPVYYQNLGTTVYLFRKDAQEFYDVTEPEVFAKAFVLYSNAMRLDPDNFPLATDVAESYYGFPPLRVEEALRAWTNALNIAHNEVEREGVYVHLARVKLLAGRFDEARAQLKAVSDPTYAELKARLERNADLRQKELETNAPAKPK